MPQPPSTWKKIELGVARYLGFVKTHWLDSDVRGPGWSIEVKHGMQIPKTILKWWGQAVKNSTSSEDTALVLHPKGWPIADSLVVVRLSLFKEFLDEKQIKRTSAFDTPSGDGK